MVNTSRFITDSNLIFICYIVCTWKMIILLKLTSLSPKRVLVLSQYSLVSQSSSTAKDFQSPSFIHNACFLIYLFGIALYKTILCMIYKEVQLCSRLNLSIPLMCNCTDLKSFKGLKFLCGRGGISKIQIFKHDRSAMFKIWFYISKEFLNL